MLSELAAALLPRCNFGASDEVACAVSGGSDSFALLALAVCSGRRATAYHVDHGIRPGSSAEADIVREGASKLGAAFVSFSVSCAPGPNLEARARKARFEVLPLEVATGHTADDQAETVLLNLLRGAGLDGLRGMQPGPRHPILALRRSETRALTGSLGLRVVEDPSNDDLAFRRNRVRQELLPLMDEIAERQVVPILARQAGIFASEAAMLDELAGAVDPTDAKMLANAPVALSRRAVRKWLSEQPVTVYPPSAAAIDRILRVARGEIRACEIEQGRRVVRSHNRLFLEDQKEGSFRPG